MRRALAGRHDPRAAHDPGDLVRSLKRDGAARTLRAGPLALAFTDPGGGGDAPGTARTACVLDGRISNLAELTRGLDLPASAEQALAAGYERHGEALLPLVRGEFVVVLWDREAGRGLVARDQLGARPLFACESGEALLFASEVRNLLALLSRRPAPDQVAVAHWLARTTLHSDRTLYEGIVRLLPGQSIRLGDRGFDRHVYWSPRYVAPMPRSRTAAAAELRAGMTDAVRRALDDDDRSGVLLSGGFDSTSIAALAAELSRERGLPLRSYSAAFPGAPSADESQRISATRGELGLDGVLAEVRGGSPLVGSLEFLQAFELPTISPNWFIWGPLLRRAWDEGITTLLDGEGGDELFGCSPFLLADLLRGGRLASLGRHARRIPGMEETPPERWIPRALVLYAARGAIPHRLHGVMRRARGRARRAPPWMTAELTRVHSDTDDPWAWKRLSGPRWWASLADRLVVANDAMQAPCQLRREAALAGLAFAHPWRDLELIELVLGLSPSFAFDARVDRPLAREAMRGVVPERVRRDVGKAHFTDVLGNALADSDLPAIRSLLEDPGAESRAYVRGEVVRSELLDRAAERARPAGWALDLWRVVTLECWLRLQSDSALPERLRTRVGV